MLRQEVVQYVSNQLAAGHSITGIKAALRQSWPEEDIEDAFEAVGYHHAQETGRNTATAFPRFLLYLVIFVLLGAMLGGGYYGFEKLRTKLSYIQQADAQQPQQPQVPAQATQQVQTQSQTLTGATSQVNNPNPAQGIGRCSLIADQNSNDAASCRFQESQSMTVQNCNTLPDSASVEQCSRAFYERNQAQAGQ